MEKKKIYGLVGSGIIMIIIGFIISGLFTSHYFDNGERVFLWIGLAFMGVGYFLAFLPLVLHGFPKE